jgi:hypothetical protein
MKFDIIVNQFETEGRMGIFSHQSANEVFHQQDRSAETYLTSQTFL